MSGCVTLVNIGVGPPNAKTMTDHWALLWLMIGHCGGLRQSQRICDYVLAHGYLCQDSILGDVVRAGDPLSPGKIAPSRYAAGQHIGQSPRDLDKGPVDEALVPSGLEREFVTIVGSFSSALAVARTSDLISCVPERHTGKLRAGTHSFPLSVFLPEITVSLLWHPWLDADLAHRWLRDACARQQ